MGATTFSGPVKSLGGLISAGSDNEILRQTGLTSLLVVFIPVLLTLPVKRLSRVRLTTSSR